MTQGEFLLKLKEALENELTGYVVQENINYYSNYILEEIKKGRGEEDVVAELGDPWVIAKTIIDSVETNHHTQEANANEPRQHQQASREQGRSQTLQVFGLDSWWKKLLLILGIIGVFAIIIAVIGGLFSLVAPFIIPILVITFVFRLIGRNRR